MNSNSCLTNESKIVKKVHNIQKSEYHYTETTIKAKLNHFKKCMYYCSCDLFNPMFFSHTKELLKIPEELIYVHRLMYQFLCRGSHKLVSFDRLDTIDDYCELPTFGWNIPDSDFPFVAAYILTSPTRSSATDFFQEITKELHTFKPEYAKFPLEKWLNDYLGKQYFISLEQFFEKYSNSTHPPKHLKNWTIGLSSLLIECPLNNETLRLIIYSLLEQYKKSVDDYVSTLPNQKNCLDILYPHDEPYILQFEKNSFQAYFKELERVSSQFINDIKAMLKVDSKPSPYGIAVNDFDKFEQSFQKGLTDFNIHTQEVLISVGSFYADLLNASSIKEKISSDILKFNEKSAIKKIEPLYRKIENYQNTLTQKFNTFLKQVQKASSETPSRYDSLKLDTNYLYLLEADVQRKTSRLEKEFSKDIPVFSRSRRGYLQEQGYCNNIFNEEDTLKLLHNAGLIESPCPNSLKQELLKRNYNTSFLSSAEIIRLLSELTQ